MMDLTDYRREFAQFHSRLELTRHEQRSEPSATDVFERVFDRYDHLFEYSAVNDLGQMVRAETYRTETDTAAIKSLYGAAVAGFLERESRAITRECQAVESSERINWDRSSVALVDVRDLLANEAELERRRELSHRWSRALRNCSELRSERLDQRRAASRKLEFSSYPAAWSAIKSCELDRLTPSTAGFLQSTASAYFHGLAKLRERDPELRHLPELDMPDQLRWRRLSRFDRLFAGWRRVDTMKMALDRLGIKVGQQQNLQVQVAGSDDLSPRSTVYRVQPPDDVRLLIGSAAGASGYWNMFEAAGQAQQQAWISPTFFSRYPEFIYSADNATPFAFGRLFRNLHLDQAWVAETYAAGNESAATELVAEFTLIALHDARENCAKLLFWNDYRRSTEGVETDYADRLRDATGFSRDGIRYLWETDDRFGFADELRGEMFEAALLEYLRSRYGKRWWADRKSSDELRDIWNTGARYSVEELSVQFGLGELSFDPLADRMIQLVRVK
ncbi:MAG: hypothetical protein ABIP75_16225 [Pyrinomonadaceae bacterium]